MITSQRTKNSHGKDIIVIYVSGDPMGHLIQIGKRHPDVRLNRWGQQSIQFPCAHLADITRQEIGAIARKYLMDQKEESHNEAQCQENTKPQIYPVPVLQTR